MVCRLRKKMMCVRANKDLVRISHTHTQTHKKYTMDQTKLFQYKAESQKSSIQENLKYTQRKCIEEDDLDQIDGSSSSYYFEKDFDKLHIPFISLQIEPETKDDDFIEKNKEKQSISYEDEFDEDINTIDQQQQQYCYNHTITTNKKKHSKNKTTTTDLEQEEKQKKEEVDAQQQKSKMQQLDILIKKSPMIIKTLTSKYPVKMHKILNTPDEDLIQEIIKYRERDIHQQNKYKISSSLCRSRNPFGSNASYEFEMPYKNELGKEGFCLTLEEKISRYSDLIKNHHDILQGYRQLRVLMNILPVLRRYFQLYEWSCLHCNYHEAWILKCKKCGEKMYVPPDYNYSYENMEDFNCAMLCENKDYSHLFPPKSKGFDCKTDPIVQGKKWVAKFISSSNDGSWFKTFLNVSNNNFILFHHDATILWNVSKLFWTFLSVGEENTTDRLPFYEYILRNFEMGEDFTISCKIKKIGDLFKDHCKDINKRHIYLKTIYQICIDLQFLKSYGITLAQKTVTHQDFSDISNEAMVVVNPHIIYNSIMSTMKEIFNNEKSEFSFRNISNLWENMNSCLAKEVKKHTSIEGNYIIFPKEVFESLEKNIMDYQEGDPNAMNNTYPLPRKMIFNHNSDLSFLEFWRYACFPNRNLLSTTFAELWSLDSPSSCDNTFQPLESKIIRPSNEFICVQLSQANTFRKWFSSFNSSYQFVKTLDKTLDKNKMKESIKEETMDPPPSKAKPKMAPKQQQAGGARKRGRPSLKIQKNDDKEEEKERIISGWFEWIDYETGMPMILLARTGGFSSHDQTSFSDQDTDFFNLHDFLSSQCFEECQEECIKLKFSKCTHILSREINSFLKMLCAELNDNEKDSTKMLACLQFMFSEYQTMSKRCYHNLNYFLLNNNTSISAKEKTKFVKIFQSVFEKMKQSPTFPCIVLEKIPTLYQHHNATAAPSLIVVKTEKAEKEQKEEEEEENKDSNNTIQPPDKKRRKPNGGASDFDILFDKEKFNQDNTTYETVILLDLECHEENDPETKKLLQTKKDKNMDIEDEESVKRTKNRQLDYHSNLCRMRKDLMICGIENVFFLDVFHKTTKNIEPELKTLPIEQKKEQKICEIENIFFAAAEPELITTSSVVDDDDAETKNVQELQETKHYFKWFYCSKDFNIMYPQERKVLFTKFFRHLNLNLKVGANRDFQTDAWFDDYFLDIESIKNNSLQKIKMYIHLWNKLIDNHFVCITKLHQEEKKEEDIHSLIRDSLEYDEKTREIEIENVHFYHKILQLFQYYSAMGMDQRIPMDQIIFKHPEELEKGEDDGEDDYYKLISTEWVHSTNICTEPIVWFFPSIFMKSNI
jgi:hypothetical protein